MNILVEQGNLLPKQKSTEWGYRDCKLEMMRVFHVTRGMPLHPLAMTDVIAILGTLLIPTE